MRVADHGNLFLFYKSMKYFSNYEADAVVREDDNGQRYIKHIEYLIERKAGKDEREAWAALMEYELDSNNFNMFDVTGVSEITDRGN